MLKRDLEAVMGEMLRQLKVAIGELGRARAAVRAEEKEVEKDRAAAAAGADALDAERKESIKQIQQSVETLQDSMQPQLQKIAENSESVAKRLVTMESRLAVLEKNLIATTTHLESSLSRPHANSDAESERACAAIQTRVAAAVEQLLQKALEKQDAMLARERDAWDALLVRERQASRDDACGAAGLKGTLLAATGPVNAEMPVEATGSKFDAVGADSGVTPIQVKSESPAPPPSANRAQKHPRQQQTQNARPLPVVAAASPRPVRTLPAAPIYVLDFEETESWTDLMAPLPPPPPSHFARPPPPNPPQRDSTDIEIFIVPDEECDIPGPVTISPATGIQKSRQPSPVILSPQPFSQVPDLVPATTTTINATTPAAPTKRKQQRSRPPPASAKKRQKIKTETSSAPRPSQGRRARGGGGAAVPRIPPDPDLRPITRAQRRKLQSDEVAGILETKTNPCRERRPSPAVL
ncbi:hypothetical protein HDU86_005946 [Geranomyces michiganensis]|nr:hypothetical protein HDU86_005946 [Geranomyces michiganensis]